MCRECYMERIKNPLRTWEQAAAALNAYWIEHPNELLRDIERARQAYRSGSTISPAELDERLFGNGREQ